MRRERDERDGGCGGDTGRGRRGVVVTLGGGRVCGGDTGRGEGVVTSYGVRRVWPRRAWPHLVLAQQKAGQVVAAVTTASL